MQAAARVRQGMEPMLWHALQWAALPSHGNHLLHTLVELAMLRGLRSLAWAAQMLCLPITRDAKARKYLGSGACKPHTVQLYSHMWQLWRQLIPAHVCMMAHGGPCNYSPIRQAYVAGCAQAPVPRMRV